MIVLRLKGGLGNQMFQYAFGSLVAKTLSKPLYLDIEFFKSDLILEDVTHRNFELDIFNNNDKIASPNQIRSFNKLSKLSKLKRKLNLNYPKKFNELSSAFLADNLNIQTPVHINGYFQSFKYYLGKENFVRALFNFPKDNLDETCKSLYTKIKQSNSISIHIRRGDYVTNDKIKKIHGNCTLEYYHNAIDKICSKVADPYLFFFSDDIDWVKNNFMNISIPKHFVSNDSGEAGWKDMYLMSSCSHHIIANSSFSWWAAWLNDSIDKIVVAPKKWFVESEENRNTDDLIPPNWIRL